MSERVSSRRQNRASSRVSPPSFSSRAKFLLPSLPDTRPQPRRSKREWLRRVETTMYVEHGLHYFVEGVGGGGGAQIKWRVDVSTDPLDEVLSFSRKRLRYTIPNRLGFIGEKLSNAIG